MTCWTDSGEAAALLASCAARPPRQKLFVYRFQEIAARFVGRRVGRLRRLYRLAEPPLDSPAWREWLVLDPQRAIEAAVRSRPAFNPSRNVAMPEPPADPLIRHNRLIAALCEDLASRDYRRTGRTPRADALCGAVHESAGPRRS